MNPLYWHYLIRKPQKNKPLFDIMQTCTFLAMTTQTACCLMDVFYTGDLFYRIQNGLINGRMQMHYYRAVRDVIMLYSSNDHSTYQWGCMIMRFAGLHQKCLHFDI